MIDIFNTGNINRAKRIRKNTGSGFLGSNLKKELLKSVGFHDKRKSIRLQKNKKCSKRYRRKFRKNLMQGINSLL